MRLFIITGVTKGLGKAMAQELFLRNSTLFLVGRKSLAELIKNARLCGAAAEGFICDLSNPVKLKELIDRMFLKIDFKKISSIVLINNAGVIEPISFVGSFSAPEAINNLNVNCVTPIVLSHLFIKKTASFKGRKIIINISSGAAKKPFAGWSLYCSAKSAVEMFTKCVAVEQGEYRNGVKIFCVDPGALDTDMQFQIRKKSKQEFPCVEKFITLYKSKTLKSAKVAAREIRGFIDTKLGGGSL
jgi:benzil reductase ((S)-benzoin forming)